MTSAPSVLLVDDSADNLLALETVLDEEGAKSEQFKKVLENWRAFRAEQHRWFSVADARTEMSVYALTTATQ